MPDLVAHVPGKHPVYFRTHSLLNIPETWFTHWSIWEDPKCLGRSVNQWMNALSS